MYGKKLDAAFRYAVCSFLLGIVISAIGFSVEIHEILYIGCVILGLSTLVFIVVCILGSYIENDRYRLWLQERNVVDDPVIIVVNPRVNPRVYPRIARIPPNSKKVF